MRTRIHGVPLRYIQKSGCVLPNRYFSARSCGFSKDPHALAEAGAEAGVTSEEAAPCGGSLPIATARSGKSLRGRLAALHIRIVGRARQAIGSRDLDLHIPGQHQIGHEHGQDMLDAVRHGADERDIAV